MFRTHLEAWMILDVTFVSLSTRQSEQTIREGAVHRIHPGIFSGTPSFVKYIVCPKYNCHNRTSHIEVHLQLPLFLFYFLNFKQVMILTGEGGKLKRNIPLVRGRDFEIIPEPVWRALQQWYGGGPALPRTVLINLWCYANGPFPTVIQNCTVQFFV